MALSAIRVMLTLLPAAVNGTDVATASAEPRVTVASGDGE